MKWIPGYKTELLPPIDNADYPKQYVVRVKGDDPHSGWIYISHETAEKMRDINEDGYWEWLDESSTTADASVLVRELENIINNYDHDEDAHKHNNLPACRVCSATKALAQYSTQSPSSIEESGLKEGEEEINEAYVRKFLIDNRVIRANLQEACVELLLSFHNHITKKP